MREKINALKVVVTGMEHAGTTLLAQLLRQHPHLETGYEVGVLQFKNPHTFWRARPQWTNENSPYGILQGWKMTPEGYKKLQRAKTFEEFYEVLRLYSGLVRFKYANLIDKTPPYQDSIETIMARFDVKVLCIVKDPILLYDSWGRRGHPDIGFIKYYRPRVLHTIAAMNAYPDDIRVIPFEILNYYPEMVMEMVFEWLGLDPIILGQQIDTDFPSKVPNIVGEDISMRYLRVPYASRFRIQNELGDLCYLRYGSEGMQIIKNRFWWRKCEIGLERFSKGDNSIKLR